MLSPLRSWVSCGKLAEAKKHYTDVIMTTMASQITSPTVVYSTVYSDADQRKHQSSTSLAFVWGIHRDRWIPRTKGQLRGKCFRLMTSSWKHINGPMQQQNNHCTQVILLYINQTTTSWHCVRKHKNTFVLFLNTEADGGRSWNISSWNVNTIMLKA